MWKGVKHFITHLEFRSDTLERTLRLRREVQRERELDAIRMHPDFSDYLQKANEGMSKSKKGSFRRTH